VHRPSFWTCPCFLYYNRRRRVCWCIIQSQARPLTRYLPVRGEPLDLLGFVEQAGHVVDRCADDIIVTSDRASGFLVKMGGRIRTWRRRWFVFDRVNHQITYYVDQPQSLSQSSPSARPRRPKGCIDFSVFHRGCTLSILFRFLYFYSFLQILRLL